MKIVWITDPHFDHAGPKGTERLLAKLEKSKPDGLFLTGDIATGDSVEHCLRTFAENFDFPVWFVLGNHDYYGARINQVRQFCRELGEKHENLFYMNYEEVIKLTDNTGLIGHDGWGDCRVGTAENTPWINDSAMIHDLIGQDRESVVRICRNLGDEAAAHIEKVLQEALERFDNVILITHVPPYEEAAKIYLRPGQISLVAWFACKAVGDVIDDVMSKHPGKNLTVYCGHSHSKKDLQVHPNVRVLVGGASYGQPHLQKDIIIS